MRLAIDIDSTLHPYWDQLAAVARRRFGIDLPYDRQLVWDIHQLRPEQLPFVEETHRELVLRRRALPGGGGDDQRWREQGHFIHITWHRATDAHPHTQHGSSRPAHDELYCSYDKITRCVELGIDLLIDDSPVNLARAVEAGITAATSSTPGTGTCKGVICAPTGRARPG